MAVATVEIVAQPHPRRRYLLTNLWSALGGKSTLTPLVSRSAPSSPQQRTAEITLGAAELSEDTERILNRTYDTVGSTNRRLTVLESSTQLNLERMHRPAVEIIPEVPEGPTRMGTVSDEGITAPTQCATTSTSTTIFNESCEHNAIPLPPTTTTTTTTTTTATATTTTTTTPTTTTAPTTTTPPTTTTTTTTTTSIHTQSNEKYKDDDDITTTITTTTTSTNSTGSRTGPGLAAGRHSALPKFTSALHWYRTNMTPTTTTENTTTTTTKLTN